MESRRERLELNQRTFRSANEGMAQALHVNGSTRIPFLCECADLYCLGCLEATFAEFEEAHKNDNRFFILPGHPRLDGEEILSKNGRYEIVSKS